MGEAVILMIGFTFKYQLRSNRLRVLPMPIDLYTSVQRHQFIMDTHPSNSSRVNSNCIPDCQNIFRWNCHFMSVVFCFRLLCFVFFVRSAITLMLCPPHLLRLLHIWYVHRAPSELQSYKLHPYNIQQSFLKCKFNILQFL